MSWTRRLWIPSPAALNGLGGVAYELLRLSGSVRLPNLLTLQMQATNLSDVSEPGIESLSEASADHVESSH